MQPSKKNTSPQNMIIAVLSDGPSAMLIVARSKMADESNDNQAIKIADIPDCHNLRGV
jgi:hypothetical protein